MPNSSPSRSPEPLTTTAGDHSLTALGLSPKFLILALLPLLIVLASLVTVAGASVLGMVDTEVFYSTVLATEFVACSAVLPFACWVHLANERRRAKVDERMSEFASRLVEFYGACSQSSQVDEDQRTAEAFRLYILAEEELGKEPLGSQQGARELIDHGSYLARRVLVAGT